jgi:hypothetical protein
VPPFVVAQLFRAGAAALLAKWLFDADQSRQLAEREIAGPPKSSHQELAREAPI